MVISAQAQAEVQEARPAAGILSQLFDHPSLQSARMRVPARHVLYSATDPANEVYLIRSGQVRTWHGGAGRGRRMIEILGAGDWFGAAALGGLPCYGECAETASESELIRITASDWMNLATSEPSAAAELVRQLVAKLAASRDEASRLVFDDCHRRLIGTLVRLSDSAAASPAPEGVVLRITHQQLAQAVGVARETVSLALSQFRRRGLLRTGRNQLMFDPRKLNDESVASQ